MIESPTVALPINITQSTPTPTPGTLITSDLLFIIGHRLQRWDHITQFSGSLVENVLNFSSSGNGIKIALMRSKGSPTDGNTLIDVDLLDFASKQTSHLLENTPQILDMAVSPDGSWLAYQQIQGGNPAIFLLSITSPSNPRKLGQCVELPTGGCTKLSWSLDSQSLLWGDERGLWIAPIGIGSTSLVHDSMVDIIDPKKNTSHINVKFSSPQWSPAGRFILVEATPDESDASWYVVIDSLTGHSSQVLDTYQLPHQPVSLNWLSNGQLAVARSSDKKLGMPAAIQIWSVLATNPSLLVASNQYQFPTGVPLSGPIAMQVTNPVTAHLQLNWIQGSSPGHILFSAMRSGSDTSETIFELNLATRAVTQVAELDSGLEYMLWAPDGSGILVITTDHEVLFIPSSDPFPVDLKLGAGANPTGFTWLLPTLRK